ncbi:hypothetical protein DGG96_18145 [Legionella qingyii]|uniref:Uncharacterized protein n=1 Tax=Legionella qingyii TaxID=2184757 RepID=A0A317U0E4_9GAMM|nr:hypothetical protein [Legionella qingyii]PWY54196.1 hypothetical protein DGG96_18145 [Legionella qingyii]RUR19831.1 hypothetical protein ELY20_15555 [Legionella qingyii]RUR22161.1 hypothetical protein ELY16_15125 [Legionella qingyii]
MGKHSKEVNAFNAAKKLRETLIEQLKKCNSPEDLERFLKKYHENLKKRVSTIRLTPYHQEELNSLDREIKELTHKLRVRFSPEVQIESSPSTHERHEELPVLVEESASLTTTPEPMKENHLLQQQVEHKAEASIEKEKEDALASTQPKTPLESLTRRGRLERENSGVLEPPKTRHSVKSKKTLSDNKLSQETYVDPRIIDKRRIYIFDVKVKLRAIQAKHKIYEEKAKKYQNEKNQKEFSKYSNAATAAKSIHAQISALIRQYVVDGNLVSFKSRSQEVLGEDKEHVKTLRTHRGWWEKFLDDLVDLINTGLNRVGSTVRMHELSMFKPLADGGKKVTELNNAISSLKATV